MPAAGVTTATDGLGASAMPALAGVDQKAAVSRAGAPWAPGRRRAMAIWPWRWGAGLGRGGQFRVHGQFRTGLGAPAGQ